MPREGRPDRAALSAVDRRWRSLKWRANRERKLESLPDDEKEKEKARLRAADRARVRRYRARIRQQREAAAALAGLDVDAQSRTRTRSSSGPPPSPPPSPPPRGACPALCPTLQRLVRLERDVRVDPDWEPALRRVFDDWARNAGGDGDAVEQRAGKWAVLMDRGEWVDFAAKRTPLATVAILKRLQEVLTALVKKRKEWHVEGDEKTKVSTILGTYKKVQPWSLIVRQYTGGGDHDELPKAHCDTLDYRDEDGNTIHVEKECVSVVFVLSGGYSLSGIDVEAIARKRHYPLRLETGDAVIIADGVEHVVRFTGVKPPIGGWRPRLSVVAFFARE